MAEEASYKIVGREVSSTGTPHLQGYVQFASNKRLSGVRKLLPTAHWELAKGDAGANYAYCSKDQQFEEIGERRLTSKEQGLKQKELWTDVIRAAEAGTAKEEYPQQWVQYHSTLTKLYRPVLADLDAYKGLWFVGPPGTGKSRYARQEYPGAYDKLLNKWWDGYENQDAVLIDDIGHANVQMGSFLKRYADHYPFRAEFKGGSMVIRPKVIIVTSNYRIEELWPYDAPLQAALKRRFHVVNFHEKL